jgi:hypothetical protein
MHRKKPLAKRTRRRKPNPPQRARRRAPLEETFKSVPANREAFAPEPVQAGDLSGLSAVPMADSESVEELAENGQDFEAELMLGIQQAPEPDFEEE